LYQHTGTSFGSDVEKVLRESPSKAEHTNVPWYDAVVYDGWKYIHYLKPGVGDELYELKADPEELENRIKDPKAASRLIQLREKMDGELKRNNAGKREITIPALSNLREFVFYRFMNN
jgi:arylsulfatase A-like enzyme